jgi:hypothetical protein
LCRRRKSSIIIQAFKKKCDIDSECLRKYVKATGSDSVDTLLVFVRLLVGDANKLGKFLLADAENEAPLAYPFAHVPIDIPHPRMHSTLLLLG